MFRITELSVYKLTKNGIERAGIHRAVGKQRGGGDIFDGIIEEYEKSTTKKQKSTFPQLNFDDEMGVIRWKIAKFLGIDIGTFAICDVQKLKPLDFEYVYVNKNTVYSVNFGENKQSGDEKFESRLRVGAIKLVSYSDAILYDRLGAAVTRLSIVIGTAPFSAKFFPALPTIEISEASIRWIDEQLGSLDSAAKKINSYTSITVNHLNIEILTHANIGRIIWNLKQIFVGFKTTSTFPMIVYSDPIEYGNLVRVHNDFVEIADYIASRNLSERIQNNYEPQYLHVVMVTPEKILINVSFEHTGYAQLRTRFPYGTVFGSRTIQNILEAFVKFRDYIYEIPGSFSREMEIFIDHSIPKMDDIVINWLNVNISPNSNVTLDANRYQSAITYFSSLFGDFKIGNGKIKEFVYMRTKNRSPANITTDGKIRFNNIISRSTLEAIKFRIDQIIDIVIHKSHRDLESYIGNMNADSGRRDMKVRILQSKDPVLFNYRKTNPGDKHQTYSKICQFEQQPHVYDTMEDARRHTKTYVLEYDNKSFPGKKQFYTCPSKKYPYPSFKEAKKHPAGFCVPCCRKVSSIENKKSVNYINYHSCLEGTDVDYEQNNMNLKYVRNLHKILQESHLAHLPETLESYVNKNMKYKINQRHNLENGSDCYLVSGLRENESPESIAPLLGTEKMILYIITKTGDDDSGEITVEKKSGGERAWILYNNKTNFGKGITQYYPVARITITENGKIERQYIFDENEPIVKRLDKLIEIMKKQNSVVINEKIQSGAVLDLTAELIEYLIKYHLQKYSIRLVAQTDFGGGFTLAALVDGRDKIAGIIPIEGSITRRYSTIQKPAAIISHIKAGLDMIKKWTRASVTKIYSDGFLINNKYFVQGKVAEPSAENYSHLSVGINFTPAKYLDDREKYIAKKIENDEKYRKFILELSAYINTKRGNPSQSAFRREFVRAKNDAEKLGVIRKHSPRPEMDRKMIKWFDTVTFEADKILKYELDKIREIGPMKKKIAEIVTAAKISTDNKQQFIERAAIDLLGNFIRRKEILDGDQISLTEHIRLGADETLIKVSPVRK